MKHGDLVMECYPNVLTGAKLFCRRWPGVNYSDAVSAGTEALIEAADRFAPVNNVTAGNLWHFVKMRIAGSLTDMVRQDRATHRGTGKRRLVALRRDFPRPDACHDPFVVQALGVLTPREREAIHRLFWEGMNYAEAAAAMDVNPSRVYQLKKTALARMRNYLA